MVSDTANCTGGNCERRVLYLLQTAADLIIADLEEMVANWADDGNGRDANGGLTTMLTGLAQLIKQAFWCPPDHFRSMSSFRSRSAPSPTIAPA